MYMPGLKQEIERILAVPYIKRDLNEIYMALNKTKMEIKKKIKYYRELKREKCPTKLRHTHLNHCPICEICDKVV